MIAVGLAIELIAAAVLLVGLVLGDEAASALLWASVALAIVGLAGVCVGVARARPPRRRALLAASTRSARTAEPGAGPQR